MPESVEKGALWLRTTHRPFPLPPINAFSRERLGRLGLNPAPLCGGTGFCLELFSSSPPCMEWLSCLGCARLPTFASVNLVWL